MLELMQANNCNCLNCLGFFHTQRKFQSHMVWKVHIWKLIKILSRRAYHLDGSKWARKWSNSAIKFGTISCFYLKIPWKNLRAEICSWKHYFKVGICLSPCYSFNTLKFLTIKYYHLIAIVSLHDRCIWFWQKLVLPCSTKERHASRIWTAQTRWKCQQQFWICFSLKEGLPECWSHCPPSNL